MYWPLANELAPTVFGACQGGWPEYRFKGGASKLASTGFAYYMNVTYERPSLFKSAFKSKKHTTRTKPCPCAAESRSTMSRRMRPRVWAIWGSFSRRAWACLNTCKTDGWWKCCRSSSRPHVHRLRPPSTHPRTLPGVHAVDERITQ